MTQIYAENLKKADINISSSGDNTVISASTNGYIVIDHINLLTGGAVNVQLKDGSSVYGGAYQLTSNQAITLENTMQNEKGIITLTPGNAFIINLSAAVQISGFIRYRIIGE